MPKADKLAYSDKTIDPYATYLYRVLATRQPDNSSTSNPSSEVIVGPPPPGMSLVTPYRPELNLYEPTDFGRRTAIALDSNGDPAIVYYIFTPEEYHLHSFLEFVSWDRASYRWNPPWSWLCSYHVPPPKLPRASSHPDCAVHKPVSCRTK